VVRRPTLLVLIVVLIGVGAACSADDKNSSPEMSPSASPESSVTSSAAADLGDPRESGIEGLPVPSTASLTEGFDTCADALGCDEEYWRVEGATANGLRDWYREHLEGGVPWREWQPCGDDVSESGTSSDPDARVLTYQWHKTDIELLLQTQLQRSSSAPRVHLRVQPGELPCN
jgi:hypothetical protein